MRSRSRWLSNGFASQVPSGGALIDGRATALCPSDWPGWKGDDPAICLPRGPVTRWPAWLRLSVINCAGYGRATSPATRAVPSGPHAAVRNSRASARGARSPDCWSPGCRPQRRPRDRRRPVRRGAAALDCRFTTAFAAVLASSQNQWWVRVSLCAGSIRPSRLAARLARRSAGFLTRRSALSSAHRGVRRR